MIRVLIADHQPIVSYGIRMLFESSSDIKIVNSVNTKKQLMDYLKINGISTSIYYKTPVHQLPALSFMKKSFKLDKTVSASETVLSLPLYPFAKKSEMERVVKKILNFS